MSDRIFAGIWLLLCIGGMFVAWQIHSEYSYEPVGPRPFPVGIVGLMLLGGAAAAPSGYRGVAATPYAATSAGNGNCPANVRVGL